MADRVNEHDEIENAVAAFALGACEPEEAEIVRAHLDACASCRQLFERLGRAVAAIPLAAQEVQPPARLRERILSAAAASANEPVVLRQSWRKRFAMPRTGAALRRPQFSWAAGAVAALALAVVGLGLWNVALSRQLDSQRRDVARFQIDGTGPMANSTANVVALQQEQLILVDFRGMPQVQPGKVYELWLGTPGGKMIPAGVFKPDSDGSKILVLNRDLRGYTAIAVTVESGPTGAPAPTQSPQLSRKLI